MAAHTQDTARKRCDKAQQKIDKDSTLTSADNLTVPKAANNHTSDWGRLGN